MHVISTVCLSFAILSIVGLGWLLLLAFGATHNEEKRFSQVLSDCLINGIAVVMAVGGICHLLQFPFSIVTKLLFLSGTLSFLFLIVPRRKLFSDYTKPLWTILLLVMVTSLVVKHAVPNIADDPGNYFYLARKLLAGESLKEPFSFWRLVNVGGVTTFHGLGFSIDSIYGPWLTDMGLGLAILFFQFLNKPRSFSKVFLGTFILFLTTVWSFAISAANSVPRILPFVLIYTAIDIGVKGLQNKKITMASWMTMLSCFVIVLLIRPHIALTLLLLFLSSMILSPLFRLSFPVRQFSICLALALIPYFWASWRDTGTPFWPLMMGNFDTNWLGTEPLPLSQSTNVSFSDYLLGLECWKIAVVSVLLSVLTWTRKKTSVDGTQSRNMILIQLVLLSEIALIAVSLQGNGAVNANRYLMPISLCMLLLALAHSAQKEFPIRQRNFSFELLSFSVSLFLVSSIFPYTIHDTFSSFARSISGISVLVTSVPNKEVKPESVLLSSLVKVVGTDDVLLTAIRDTDTLVGKGLRVQNVGVLGEVYPKPHDFAWSAGLSPTAEKVLLRIYPKAVKINESVILLENGEPHNSVSLSFERTEFGFRFVLTKTGMVPQASEPFHLGPVFFRDFQLEIDKKRNLVAIYDPNLQIILGGNAYKFEGSYFSYATNLLSPPVTPITQLQVEVLSVLKPTDLEFYFKEFITGLIQRKVSYVLFESPHREPVALYSESIWIDNAVSDTAYASQSPYFFAWFDFLSFIRDRGLCININGEFFLLDLKNTIRQIDSL